MLAIEDWIWPGLVLFAWLFLGGAILTGCALPEPNDPWCEVHRCDWVPLAFSSESPEHEPLVGALAERLSKATGATISYDAFGIPVFFQPEVTDPNTGKLVCGYTRVAWDSTRYSNIKSVDVQISTNPPGACMPVGDVLVHEAIHAFGRSEHAASGIFAEGGAREWYLEGESLDALCGAIGGCWARKAETAPWVSPSAP